MTAMTEDQRAAAVSELADLERIVEKRRDEPGYAANVAAMDARIAALRKELDAA